MKKYKTIKYNNKFILYHRYIYEQHNGPIPDGCVIHHIDGDIYNNDISNLQCMTNSQHSKLHHKKQNKNNTEYQKEYREKNKEKIKQKRQEKKDKIIEEQEKEKLLEYVKYMIKYQKEEKLKKQRQKRYDEQIKIDYQCLKPPPNLF